MPRRFSLRRTAETPDDTSIVELEVTSPISSGASASSPPKTFFESNNSYVAYSPASTSYGSATSCSEVVLGQADIIDIDESEDEPNWDDDDDRASTASTHLQKPKTVVVKDDDDGSDTDDIVKEKRESKSGAGYALVCCCCCAILLIVVLLVVLLFFLQPFKSSRSNSHSSSQGESQLNEHTTIPTPNCADNPLLCGDVPSHMPTNAPTRDILPIVSRNLFLEASSFWVPPQWQWNIQNTITRTTDATIANRLEEMKVVASAAWITEKKRISGQNTTGELRGMLLDAASRSPPPLAVVVLYDLPNRNCAAGVSSRVRARPHALDSYLYFCPLPQVSTGEICCSYNSDGSCDFDNSGDCQNGLDDYKHNFIDLAVSVLVEFDGIVPIAVIIEPDSLPNLATNFDDERCGNSGTWRAYTEGVKYAVTKIASRTREVAIYLDAAHGGWLGWQSSLDNFVDVVRPLDIVQYLRGFVTNVANYQPLGTPCPDDVDCIVDVNRDSRACCQDPCNLILQYNSGNNEHNYAKRLVQTFKNEFSNFDPHVIIDTGRNGNADARTDCSAWCNPRDMRVGRSSSAFTMDSSIIDAYFWIKSPGYSDGCSKFLPSADDPFTADGECARFDSACASVDSIGTRPNEPYAPEAGAWFEHQVQMLAGSTSFVEFDPPTSEPTASPTYNPTYSPTRSPSTGYSSIGDANRAPTRRPVPTGEESVPTHPPVVRNTPPNPTMSTQQPLRSPTTAATAITSPSPATISTARPSDLIAENPAITFAPTKGPTFAATQGTTFAATQETTFAATQSTTFAATQETTFAATQGTTFAVTQGTTFAATQSATTTPTIAPHTTSTTTSTESPVPEPVAKPTRMPTKPTQFATVRPTDDTTPHEPSNELPQEQESYHPTYSPTKAKLCLRAWDECALSSESCCEGYKCAPDVNGYLLCQADENRTCLIEHDACTDDNSACCQGLGCYYQNDFYAACLRACPDDFICN